MSANKDQLGPQSYLDVLKCFSMQAADEEHCVGQLDSSEKKVQSYDNRAGLRSLDENITQALANMDYPQQWKDPPSHPKEGKL